MLMCIGLVFGTVGYFGLHNELITALGIAFIALSLVPAVMGGIILP